ncbi:MAG TPA: hypothetical protein VMU77_04930, partial [Acidimicrobiales bacterium]|nr:hypothetical protein [Acidimicrobiales bacterium]
MDDSASGSAGSVAIEIERLTGGEVVELAANRTMVLDDPDTALVVEEGNVLVFAVELVDSKPLGKRHLLCTLEPGDGAFGVSIESRSAMGLLATGIGSSRVRRISIGDLRAQLAGGPRSTDHSGDAVAYCVESWIELLTLRISTGRLPGGLQSTLSAGIEELESDQAECPPEGVMWAEARQGSILASGCEESITSPGDPLLPISENGWISSIDSAQVMMIASGDALGTDAGWAGLKRFTAVAVDVMARTALSDVNRRKIAARRSAIRDAQLTERAINDLAEVLPSRHREIHRAVENPLDEALKSVEDQLGVSMAQEQEIAGEAMGSATDSPQNLDIDVAGDVVEFDERNTDTEQDGKPTAQGPVRTRKDDERAELVAYSDLLNKLRRMAGRTGCRARRASLDPWWWESDNGPLIGFVAADWRPVALLRGHGGYEAYDPTLGTRVKVDRAYAETLRYEAVAFSRGLAAELHRATTLLLHAVKGSGVDLVKVLIFGSLAGLASLVVP